MSGRDQVHKGLCGTVAGVPMVGLRLALALGGLALMVGARPASATSELYGSAVDRLEAVQPQGQGIRTPDLYGAWRIAAPELSSRREAPADVAPIQDILSRDQAEPPPLQSEASRWPLGGTIGMVIGGGLSAILVLVAWRRVHRSKVHPSTVESRGTGGGVGVDAPVGPSLPDLAGVDGWALDRLAVRGDEQDRAEVPRLERPPSPEEMNRHLEELLGKVRGAKPLHKHNDEL